MDAVTLSARKLLSKRPDPEVDPLPIGPRDELVDLNAVPPDDQRTIQVVDVVLRRARPGAILCADQSVLGIESVGPGAARAGLRGAIPICVVPVEGSVHPSSDPVRMGDVEGLVRRRPQRYSVASQVAEIVVVEVLRRGCAGLP